jgi:ADP-ribose pyrophosphatase YjhB (NUDIX family)
MSNSMKFCSNCGGAVSCVWMAHEAHQRYRCAACGMTHYQNPRTIVASVVHYRGKVLMCRRAQPPAVGQWVLPSGFLEIGETLQEGAARETLEETGVRVNPTELELYSVVNMTAIEQITIAFRVELAAPPMLRAGPECLEVGFKGQDEAPSLEVAWSQSMADSAERLFEEVRTGRFSIHLVTMGSSKGAGYSSREYSLP